MTEQVAILPPSSVVTVIIAVPTFIADTLPFESTKATLEFELDHVTFLFVAFVGDTIAVNFSTPPISNDIDDLSKLTPVTAIVWALTVTEHVACFPPSFVITVIVADPAALAVTTPELETVATEVLLEDQDTDLSVAFEGVTVAVSV